MASGVDRNEILQWLREDDETKLDRLWKAADTARSLHVGDEVHLRGLIELSNHCARQCGYCGIRAANEQIDRYRMSAEEVMACAHKAASFGYGTVVIQAGEDYGIKAEWMAQLVREIKRQTSLAITLSLGERRQEEYALWRKAGADRYLLRFETSDPSLYRIIHPDLGSRPSDRVAILRALRAIGFEIGSGVMVGIPGQSYETLADDIELFRELDLDMIGVGPYLPHPGTPMGVGEWIAPLGSGAQVPGTEKMVYKAVALSRLVCPQANIPSTTALATINKERGREFGLQRGANVVMPNVTPPTYRERYEIYPDKACIHETAEACHTCLAARVRSIVRTIGKGEGGRLTSNQVPVLPAATSHRRLMPCG